ncbi:MAG: hypothetical protein PHY02_01455 [Phycisphaerae bacterium]|nr:hypothetical protein [Phycisphaerae bacterium]
MPKKSAGLILADSTSQESRPGTSRNFIMTTAVIMAEAIVAKMAMPPPRATVERWYLSAAG